MHPNWNVVIFTFCFPKQLKVSMQLTAFKQLTIIHSFIQNNLFANLHFVVLLSISWLSQDIWELAPSPPWYSISFPKGTLHLKRHPPPSRKATE